MDGVDGILNEPDIRSFLEKNQNAAERVKRAAACLVGQGDATPAENMIALRKLLPSLAEQVIRVFFSYKTKDERAATTIVQLLRQNAADKLKITFQNEFPQAIAGREWRQYICKEVRRSNWFILLLPDPSDELDWCLFETGLFEGQLTAGDRLICLHHPDTAVPSPIKDYQAVAAKRSDVEKFLQMVYIKEDPIFGLPPINPAIETMIPELAQKLVDAITVPKGRPHRSFLVPWVEIRHDGAAALKSKEDLDEASVVRMNKLALDLFGLIEFKKTFGELREAAEEDLGDSRWREELFHVLRKIAGGRAFRPIQAVLNSQNGKIYRPSVTAVDRAGAGGPIQTYHITFAEDVTTADLGGMPNDLAMLATLLRFTFRFRWEVLEPFARGPLAEADVARLEVALARIKADWEAQGSFDQDVIKEQFTESQREKLAAMFEAWERLSNADQDGELDVAIRKKDGNGIAKLLASMLPANQQFLEMAAARFAALVSEADDRDTAARQ